MNINFTQLGNNVSRANYLKWGTQKDKEAHMIKHFHCIASLFYSVHILYHCCPRGGLVQGSESVCWGVGGSLNWEINLKVQVPLIGKKNVSMVSFNQITRMSFHVFVRYWFPTQDCQHIHIRQIFNIVRLFQHVQQMVFGFCIFPN